MNINIHDVQEIRVTKTATYNNDINGKDFYANKIIITDTDNRTFVIDLFSDVKEGLKVVDSKSEYK